jgi:hypothetical protein
MRKSISGGIELATALIEFGAEYFIISFVNRHGNALSIGGWKAPAPHFAVFIVYPMFEKIIA